MRCREKDVARRRTLQLESEEFSHPSEHQNSTASDVFPHLGQNLIHVERVPKKYIRRVGKYVRHINYKGTLDYSTFSH